MSPRAPAAPPVARPAGGERLVAVALAAMAAVLLLVWVHRRNARAETPPLDFQNPLLTAEAGECLESEDQSLPGVVSRLVVIAVGDGAARGTGAAVLRTRHGPASIPGYYQAGNPDLRDTAPYLACEVRSTAEAPTGAPPGKREVLLFDLNGFGLPRGAAPNVVLREIRPALVRWQGKPQRCHQVTITRHDELAGNWALYLTKDAPAIGTILRKFFRETYTVHQAFHPCR